MTTVNYPYSGILKNFKPLTLPSAVNDYPALIAYSARAEALPEFLACPLSD
jgi:hypothetical protein